MSEVVNNTDTQVVVSSTNALSPVIVAEGSTAVVEAGTPTVIVAGMMGPQGATDISSMGDVDASQLQDGGILVYKQATQRWTATNTLDRQILEGGQF